MRNARNIFIQLGYQAARNVCWVMLNVTKCGTHDFHDLFVIYTTYNSRFITFLNLLKNCHIKTAVDCTFSVGKCLYYTNVMLTAACSMKSFCSVHRKCCCLFARLKNIKEAVFAFRTLMFRLFISYYKQVKKKKRKKI